MRALRSFSEKLISIVLMIILFGVSAYGQDAKIRLDAIDKLADKADQVVDVNVEGALIKAALDALVDAKDPETAKIKDVVKDLKGVYVRRLEFEKPGEYTDEDISPIREQLRAPGWSRIVGVRGKKGSENIEVYAMSAGTIMSGIAILAVEPKELTLVNIVGPIDLEKLVELAKIFGMPGLEIDRKTKKE
jgi:hypothetical protein